MPKPNRQQKSKAARARDAALGLARRVLGLRIKDKHAAHLRGLAREVNFLWNFDNELSFKMLRREGKFISPEELHKYTHGATKEGLSLHSQTVQAVNEEFVLRRRQFRKAKLRWRVSDRKRANYSLGWIPFKASAICYRNGRVHLAGHPLCLWDSYGLSNYAFGAGNISEDARGRWYLNVTVKVKQRPTAGAGAVGIDLGFQDLLATSEGVKVEARRFYRELEPALGRAQRGKKKGRVRAIHAKIANRRKDFLHKLSTLLVQEHRQIFVGDVSACDLARSPAAKSVLDAGWGVLRTMLKYKCDDAGARYQEVDERYSTQDCHVCAARCGPKGRKGLAVRAWTCSCCGAQHDRDLNAARNILLRGLSGGLKEKSAARTSAVNEGALALEAGHGLPAGGISGL